MTDKLTDETGTRSLDPKHAPVSLPAGSFDRGKLATALDKVVDASAEKRDGVIAKALENTIEGGAEYLDRDPRYQAGFKKIDVEHPTDASRRENISVFSRKEEEAAAAAAAALTPPADATTPSSTATAPKK